MSARVLIIEPASISPESSCRGVLNLELRYERQAWESFRPEMVLGSRAQLIVPHIAAQTQNAVSFFRWLRESPIRILTLAILPECPSPELLAASDIADDLVFWPVRGHELDVRIRRLLQDHARLSHEIENDLGKEMGR